MPRSQLAENVLKTSFTVIIFLIFTGYVPYKIVTSENHTVFVEIGRLRFIGPFLIVLGIIGYLMSLWRFIAEAKGSPLIGDSKDLMVEGIYRYTRNPIYSSVCLILLGEAIFFQSLEMLYYLFAWFIVFYIVVVFMEEPLLRVKFGDKYVQYCKSVPRWIPRLKPYKETTEE